MGYWKGSGMAIALDMAAALLANGRSGDQINADELGSCGGCCQIFLAFDPYLFGSKEEAEEMLNRRIAAVHAAAPEREGGRVSYPGERTVATRGEHLANGVEVDESVWEEVCIWHSDPRRARPQESQSDPQQSDSFRGRFVLQ